MEWEDWELRPWIWKELEGIGAQTMDLEGIGRNWSPDHGFGKEMVRKWSVPAAAEPGPAPPVPIMTGRLSYTLLELVRKW